MVLPVHATTLLLRETPGCLTLTLNRPEVRNAMSSAMVREISAVMEAVRDDRAVRVVLLRGAGGHFCAGGDIKDMAATAEAAPAPDGPDPVAAANRAFGRMLSAVEAMPQAVVALLEGSVMGGGFGLACVADVVLATPTVVFRLPETGLGLPPAQIAPFLVRRVGLSHARRLAVTGATVDGASALALGLVHELCRDAAALEARAADVVKQVTRCAPSALAATKQIVLSAGSASLESLLDDAAARFAVAARGPEGAEGMRAFLEKRPPSWVPGEA